MNAVKDWRVDTAPLVFFAALIAVKTYYLVGYMLSSEQIWTLVTETEQRRAMGPAAGYFLTGQFSHIAYYTVALAFDVLVFYSFWVRREAKERPQGFSENIFPLITVFVPVTGFSLMFLPQVRAWLPPYPEAFLQSLYELTPAFAFYINVGGFLIGITGAALSIWAIYHLRASFGLRAAVRTLVTTGPYKRIRHPLYFAEIIHILGIAILAATPVALALFVVAVALQVVRAKIEERKFLANVPEYASFKQQTGFLWPRLG